MQMKAEIISDDRIYARMLALELEAAGYSACICRRTGQQIAFAVIDADMPGAEPLHDAQGAIFAAVFSKNASVLETLSADASADDTKKIIFLLRPFDIAQLRDAAALAEKNAKSDNEITVDRERSSVYFRGTSAELTDKELMLFSSLAECRGKPLSRADAARAIGSEPGQCGNEVDVYVHHLRAKLLSAFGVRMISTVRGKGYMLDI